MAVVRDFRGPLRADMRRFYGMGWSDARSLPLTEVADMVAHLPPESAVMRAAAEHPDRTAEVDLLRLVEHGVRVLAWQNTKDASKGRNYPDPIRLPWDDPPQGAMRGEPLTWDEAADWYGWQAEMDRWFDE